MNLYDLNKSIVNQLTPLTVNEIGAKMDLFNSFNQDCNVLHYMLLCKEFNYYTVFEFDPMTSMPTFGAAICTIISELGEVYSAEYTEDKSAIEIWIKPNGEESALAFYLFPYESGVVYYG